jgi:hypothetical protein
MSELEILGGCPPMRRASATVEYHRSRLKARTTVSARARPNRVGTATRSDEKRPPLVSFSMLALFLV